MSDQVSGRYQSLNPYYSAFGLAANATQSDVPARSNLEIHGGGSLTEGILVTGKQALVLIPVSYGDVITNVNMPIAGKEGEASSETFAAIYTGAANGKTSTLITQSAAKTAALTKEKLLTHELKESVLITPANAPFGFVYAGFSETGTTMAEVATWKIKPKSIPYTTNSGVWANSVAAKAAGDEARRLRSNWCTK